MVVGLPDLKELVFHHGGPAELLDLVLEPRDKFGALLGEAQEQTLEVRILDPLRGGAKSALTSLQVSTNPFSTPITSVPPAGGSARRR